MKEFVQSLSPDKPPPFEPHPFQVWEDESLKKYFHSHYSTQKMEKAILELPEKRCHSKQPSALTRRIQEYRPFLFRAGSLSSDGPSGTVEGRGDGSPNSFSERGVIAVLCTAALASTAFG